MREILFRGEYTETGDWVKGFYVRLYDYKGNESHRIYPGYAETDCGDYYPDCYEVDPSTVGQFTGLTDKNGKKIFEGDIIKWEELDDMGWGQSIVGYIAFDEKELSWCVKWRSFEPDFLSEIDSTRLYVVGNIHDNPELVGVE